MGEEKITPDEMDETKISDANEHNLDNEEMPDMMADERTREKDGESPTPAVEERIEDEPKETESERYLRLAAEFDNYKKRTAREFGDLIKSANFRLLRSLVEIADNFERAITTEYNGESIEGYKKGVELIYNQIAELLSRENVKSIEAVGHVFDPNLHEAMMQQESDEYDDGVVMGEIQKGYRLDDKILRHARVIVSSGKKTEK